MASTTQGGTVGIRIGDVERERVREVLARHAGDGRLTLDELSDRLGEVYAARTEADLDRALRDLPALERAPLPAPAARTAPRAPRGDVLRFAVLAAGLIGIWAFFALTADSFYFWPIWPLTFVGLKVARRARAARSGAQLRYGWGGPFGVCGRGQRV